MDQPLTIKRKTHRSPGRPTRSQAEQRNRQLLEVALDQFLENGFERTTIEGITASVGMAKRTVYALYGDKVNLFKAALQRAIEDWIVPVEELQAAEGDDLQGSLMEIGRLLVRNILSPAGLRLMRITNAESSRMPEIGVYTLRHGTEPTVAFLADLLRRRLPAGHPAITDAEDAAYAFLHLVAGGPASMMAWGLELSEDQITRHTGYNVRLFLHGLLHQPSPN